VDAADHDRVSVGWDEARALAAAIPALAAVNVALDEAVGLVLAADVVAVTDLPPFTVSAMDGWAVSGPPPWSIVGEVRAGGPATTGIRVGQSMRVSTGAGLPVGADAVLRREHGVETDGIVRPQPGAHAPAAGRDVRTAGSECRAGDVVATAGQLVVPALLGLAAASGADTLDVVRRPTVDLLVIGDELVGGGPASHGRIRDALSPMLLPWLAALGADVRTHERIVDTATALRESITASTADLVVTTGSTAAGPRDHLHKVLAETGALTTADGVDVRPGHPMLLARLADGRPLVGLPGNPLAAVSGVVTLVVPAMRAMRGLPPTDRHSLPLDTDIPGHPHDVRLVPVRDGRPLHYIGPAMLRGLAHAQALAVIPPGGASAGDVVEVLDLPA
jgi:molybdopterin molybdotransferase